ncbi:hypothetical protein ACLOJK_028374 [Asimina triloba]
MIHVGDSFFFSEGFREAKKENLGEGILVDFEGQELEDQIRRVNLHPKRSVFNRASKELSRDLLLNGNSDQVERWVLKPYMEVWKKKRALVF